jgi:hypothetical protein
MGKLRESIKAERRLDDANRMGGKAVMTRQRHD